MQGKVKQIVGGSLSDLGDASSATENFVSEKPSEFYAQLYAQDSLYGGHVIMLGGDPASKTAATSALAAWPGHLQIGGGVNTDNAASWLDAGAAALIVTSFVFTDGQLQQDRLNALVRLVGKKRLVLDLSCRKKADGAYYVVTDRWQKFSELRVDPETLGRLAESCEEFLVHGVDVEGRKLGIDEELVDLLGRHTPISTTYAGGATTLVRPHASSAPAFGQMQAESAHVTMGLCSEGHTAAVLPLLHDARFLLDAGMLSRGSTSTWLTGFCCKWIAHADSTSGFGTRIRHMFAYRRS